MGRGGSPHGPPREAEKQHTEGRFWEEHWGTPLGLEALSAPSPGVVKNGTLHCWGADDVGQSSPPQLPKVGGVAADDDYTCALAMDGTPYCWGKNDFGQAWRRGGNHR